MKKGLYIIGIALSFVLGSCHHDPNQPSHCSNHVMDGNETGVDCGGDCSACVNTNYYINFNEGATSYNFASSILQIGNNGFNEVGGYVPDFVHGTAAGIIIDFADSATSSRILGLAGDTIFFDATSTTVRVTHERTASSAFDESDNTTDHSFFVHIQSANFLHYDSTLLEDVYVLKGDFKARMTDGNSGTFIGNATNGQFNFQFTANHYH